ncbi:MAG TPA: helix-turn-helix domain-containing protein [Longimicrobiales bacterium]|nr:helix-turn-helix domain-containing protein [Longimicrobiales bacterium]
MPSPHVIDKDLSRVAESERVAVWTQWSAETFSNILVSDCPGGSLDGFIRGVTLGAGRLLKVRSPGRRLMRRPVPQAEPALTVILQLTGVSHIEQELQSCTLTAGDISVTDGLFPFQQQVSYASELMLLQMPRETAAARYPALLQCSAHAYPACQAAAALVRSALQAAFELAVHLSGVQRERLCHALFALASLLPEDHAAPAGGDHDRQRAALTEIEEHLGEHALCAQFLAARVGLSRRRLDEIFVKHFGRPVTAYIWERRLERARDMLHDDCHAGQTITQIALSVGFEDASHFSRVFKNRFGTAPSIWRSRSAASTAH